MSTTIPTIKLSKIKPNPDNPRTISEQRFELLIENVLRYSKFFVNHKLVTKEGILQGGNQRFRAIKHIVNLSDTEFNDLCNKPYSKQGSKDPHFLDDDIKVAWEKIRKEKAIPAEWVANADDYTKDELEAFMIIDNQSFGTWNMDDLANKWDQNKLEGWGVQFNWNKDRQNDLLPIDSPEGKQVSFTAKPSPSHSDYSNFEMLMSHGNKKIAVDTIDRVRTEQNLEKLEDAFMHIINSYNK